MRQYTTGATRDSNEHKHEFARFLDPSVIREYAAYMHRNRRQSDGSMRAPDNWKKGIPRRDYMDSLFRHVVDLWEIHENGKVADVDAAEALCAIIFNAMGYLYELKKPSREKFSERLFKKRLTEHGA